MKGHTVGASTRFGPGNDARLIHGMRRRRDTQPMRDAIAEFNAEILIDLGGTAEVSATKRHLVTAYARCAVLADGLTADIIERGLVTSRGRTRAQFQQLVALVDRMTRLAGVLGVERRQRQIGLADYLAQQARRVDVQERDPR